MISTKSLFISTLKTVITFAQLSILLFSGVHCATTSRGVRENQSPRAVPQEVSEYRLCENRMADTETIVDLALKYQEMGEYSKANVCARKAWTQDPKDAFANYILGYTNLLCGISEQNNELYFRNASSLDPFGSVAHKAASWLSLYNAPKTVKIERPKISKTFNMQYESSTKVNGRTTYSRNKAYESIVDRAVLSTISYEIRSILRDERIFSILSEQKSARAYTYWILPEVNIHVREDSFPLVNLLGPLNLFRVVPFVNSAVEKQTTLYIQINNKVALSGPNIRGKVIFENTSNLNKISPEQLAGAVSEAYANSIKDLEYKIRKAILMGEASGN